MISYAALVMSKKKVFELSDKTSLLEAFSKALEVGNDLTLLNALVGYYTGNFSISKSFSVSVCWVDKKCVCFITSIIWYT